MKRANSFIWEPSAKLNNRRANTGTIFFRSNSQYLHAPRIFVEGKDRSLKFQFKSSQKLLTKPTSTPKLVPL